MTSVCIASQQTALRDPKANIRCISLSGPIPVRACDSLLCRSSCSACWSLRTSRHNCSRLALLVLSLADLFAKLYVVIYLTSTQHTGMRTQATVARLPCPRSAVTTAAVSTRAWHLHVEKSINVTTILWLQTPSTTIVAEALSQCRHTNSRWASERSARRLRRSLSWLARQMEQSRLRLLAEFESMRFPDRASCEEMPSGCQPRTPPQAVAPSRPHRLASLWGGLTSRTQSPFAQPAQQARPFDSDTPIYSSKASLATLSKVQQAPAVQVTLVFCPIPFSTYLSMYLRTYLYLQCSYRDVKSRSVQDM